MTRVKVFLIDPFIQMIGRRLVNNLAALCYPLTGGKVLGLSCFHEDGHSLQSNTM